MKLFYSLYDVMRAKIRKPRWRLTNRNTLISYQPIHNIAVKFQWLYLCFSRSRKSMKLVLKLFNARGNQKFKMAAQKWRNITHILACIQRGCTILTAKLMHSRPRSAMKLFFISYNASGSRSEI